MQPQEDLVKITTKLRELNGGTEVGNWVLVSEVYAPEKFVYTGPDQGRTEDSLAYPMRMFVNKATGEVKIYSAKAFLK
ncbi:MAG: hypothetical protein AAB780_00505 [Patescibacteria group bacterium]